MSKNNQYNFINTNSNQKLLEVCSDSINDDPSRIYSLICSGANIEAVNNLGYTPLLLACIYGKTNIAIYLINSGSNLEVEDCNGNSALIIAATNNNISIVNHLLLKDINTNVQNKQGFTAILISSQYQDLIVFELLLKKGANPLIKNYLQKHIFNINNKAQIENLCYKILATLCEKTQYLTNQNDNLEKRMDLCLNQVTDIIDQNIELQNQVKHLQNQVDKLIVTSNSDLFGTWDHV